MRGRAGDAALQVATWLMRDGIEEIEIRANFGWIAVGRKAAQATKAKTEESR